MNNIGIIIILGGYWDIFGGAIQKRIVVAISIDFCCNFGSATHWDIFGGAIGVFLGMLLNKLAISIDFC